jgi:hypothetical protein
MISHGIWVCKLCDLDWLDVGCPSSCVPTGVAMIVRCVC